MRLLLLGCAAAALVFADVASAQAPAPIGFFSVSGQGATGWRIECAYQQGSGRTRNARAIGRQDREIFIAKSRVSSATCTYSASDRGSFQLRFNTEDFDCPLETNDQGACVRQVEAGQTGEFTTTRRP